MRLIKEWLTNKNTSICNDTLSEMHEFAVSVIILDEVKEVATEIAVHCIPDKV
jgi:hypothetical protein